MRLPTLLWRPGEALLPSPLLLPEWLLVRVASSSAGILWAQLRDHSLATP